MSALFLQTSGYENDELHKCSYEGLTFDCRNLPDTVHALLNLLIIHEEQNINNIILLLVKQNPLIYCQYQKVLPPHLD